MSEDSVKIDLYNANHGKVPRDGGPYRDDIEAEQAELMRSKVEKRDPDFDNPGPSAGTVLVPKDKLVERSTNLSHVSESVEVTNEPVASFVSDTSDPFKGDPDPAQGNWDNDSSKVAALQGAVLYQELIDKNNTADKEPESADVDFDKDV